MALFRVIATSKCGNVESVDLLHCGVWETIFLAYLTVFLDCGIVNNYQSYILFFHILCGKVFIFFVKKVCYIYSVIVRGEQGGKI